MAYRLVVMRGSLIQCFGTVFNGRNGGPNILPALDFQGDNFEPKRAGRCLNFAQLRHGCRAVAIGDDRQTVQARHDFSQELESLGGMVRRLQGKTCDIAAHELK
jgi:hypothetical protein